MSTPDASLVVFPDTNFFLECRTPEECPWQQITQAAEIRLLVCRGVRREIDRWKNAGRGRKSDRARKVSAQLRAIGQRDYQPLVLRERGPRVTLGTARIVAALPNAPSELDPTHADDAIVLDILAQMNADPSLQPVLLTDDGNAADAARHVGVRAIDLPFDEPAGDRWRLDPELDGMQRRVNELERRLDLLARQAPVLRSVFLDRDGNQIERLQLEAVRYAPLQSHEVDELLSNGE
jgi:hypothetical protein